MPAGLALDGGAGVGVAAVGAGADADAGPGAAGVAEEASPEEVEAAEAASSLEGADSEESGAEGEFPPRKSVTYQPVPLSWKPAAVTCFFKLMAPHAGH